MTTCTQDKSSHTIVIKEDADPLAGSGLGGSSMLSKSQERHDDLRGGGTEKSILEDIMGDPEDFRDSDVDNEDAPAGQRGLHGAVTALGGDSSSKIVSGNAETLLPSMHLSSKEKQVPGHLLASEMKFCKSDEKIFHRQHVELDGRNRVQAGRTRYFIIKSLNHHNFEQSIQNGIWATQAMNEPILNEAFENAARVLLIFSVNMSGHFQGYAQMKSSIGQAQAHVWNETSWGGTFDVEWIRLYDLPFQRTIHLKNPLNSFKPVKISRDCQELTEEIGEALCALIDEGASGGEGTKRKNVHLEGCFSKRAYTERMPWASGDAYITHGMLPTEDPWSSSMYPYGFPNLFSNNYYNLQVPPPTEGFIAQASFTNPTNPSLTRLGRGSPKRSSSSSRKHPYEDSEERGRREQMERRGLALSEHKKRSSRVGPNPRTTQFPYEEDDLLNMTYEEYLQRVGNTSKHGHHHQVVTRLDDDDR